MGLSTSLTWKTNKIKMLTVAKCNVVLFIQVPRRNLNSLIPYLLVHKLTFYDQKISPKNRPQLIHESYTKT